MRISQEIKLLTLVKNWYLFKISVDLAVKLRRRDSEETPSWNKELLCLWRIKFICCHFALNNTIFAYNNTYYRQVLGKAVFICKKENSALTEHTCLTNHTIGWDKSKIITTHRRYHQHLCLEA